jgi:hypothetical protein
MGEGDQRVAGIRTNTDPYPEVRVFPKQETVEIELKRIIEKTNNPKPIQTALIRRKPTTKQDDQNAANKRTYPHEKEEKLHTLRNQPDDSAS